MSIQSAACTSATTGHPLRIAFVGDSITWVDGMLADGFVGRADEYVRSRYTETVMHDQMSRFGRFETVRSRKLLGETATKLLGIGSTLSFDMGGDELTVVQAKERTNESATRIDLYVNGVLFDTFSNWNEEPCGSQSLRFSGDGKTVIFDLGRAFTYAHRVAVDGRALTGTLLTAGYGAGFPVGQDFTVIRKYAAIRRGDETDVHHFVWFRSPPQPGASIEVTFRYGETIAYAKGTVGETGQAIDTPLESRYGDNSAERSGACGPISFGLSFRESDNRAAITWRFPYAAKRSFELRIRGFDSRGEAKGEPYALINFASNRQVAILNAGIGGKSARWFNGDDPLLSIRKVLDWKPDIVFIGLGTNDDWEPGNGFAAWRSAGTLEEAEVRSRPVLHWKSCTLTEDGAYHVETAELKVAAVTERAIVIDGTNTTFDHVAAGDIVVIGDYYGDNRNVQCRILTGWDADTRVGTFAEPLTPTAVTERIADYAGQAVRIKRIEGFTRQMIRLIQTVKKELPACRIALWETGLSNFDTRLLMGYPEQIRRIAERLDVSHVPIYMPLMEWQYAQTPDLPVYPKAERMGVYRLTAADGQDVHEQHGMLLRNWSVRVNGVERYGKGCRIEGGFALAFAPGANASQLTFADGEGRRSKHVTYRYLPAQLVFFKDIPPLNATIEVKVASVKWSADDTHLNLPFGIEIYARQALKVLECILGETEK